MINSSRVCAIVTAAGLSTRMNSPINKNFLTLCGKSVLAHTLTAFAKADVADGMIITCRDGEQKYVEESLEQVGMSIDDVTIVLGGPTRQHSVYNALCNIKNDDFAYVLIHDAARCLVTHDLIKAVLRDTCEYEAATAAVRASDTLMYSGEDERGCILQTYHDRQHTYMIQTPQGFSYPLIMAAHEKAAESGCEATDDTALAKKEGAVICLTRGSRFNLKLTTPEDLTIAKAILQLRTDTEVL